MKITEKHKNKECTFAALDVGDCFKTETNIFDTDADDNNSDYRLSYTYMKLQPSNLNMVCLDDGLTYSITDKTIVTRLNAELIISEA